MTTTKDEKDLPVGQEGTTVDRDEAVTVKETATVQETVSKAEAASDPRGTQTEAFLKTMMDTWLRIEANGSGSEIPKIAADLIRKTTEKLDQRLQEVADFKAMTIKEDVEGLKLAKNALLDLFAKFVNLKVLVPSLSHDDVVFDEDPLKFTEAEAMRIQHNTTHNTSYGRRVCEKPMHTQRQFARAKELLNLSDLDAKQENELINAVEQLLKLVENSLNRRKAIIYESLRKYYGPDRGYNDYLVLTYAEIPFFAADVPCREALPTGAEIVRNIILKAEHSPRDLKACGGTGDSEKALMWSGLTMEKFEQKMENVVRAILQAGATLVMNENRLDENRYNLFLNGAIHQELTKDLNQIRKVLDKSVFTSLEMFEKRIDETIATILAEGEIPPGKVEKIKIALFDCTSLKAWENEHQKVADDIKTVLSECGYGSIEEVHQRLEELRLSDYGVTGEWSPERCLVRNYRYGMALSAMQQPIYQALRKRGYTLRELRF